MTHAEVKAMVEEMGVPYAYDHFAEGESPDPPFICFLYPGSDNFGADNIVYHKSSELDIEVYTDRKDPDLEARVEDILTEHELYYEKSEVWINSEQMYEVLYSMIPWRSRDKILRRLKTMANANKVKYGLKNVYYAIAAFDEDGVPTYQTPVRLPGAVNLSLDAEGESENWFADDEIYVVLYANNGYAGELELALIPDSFLTDVLHEVKDSNGVFVEQSDVEVVHFALLFEFNGDVKKSRHCFFNCTCSRPGIEAATTEDTNEPQTDTLSITAMPLADGTVKSKTGDDCTDEVFNNWFKAVYLPAEG